MTTPKTYCNPLPLEHYQAGRKCLREGYRDPQFREMADPTVIRFQDRWYLFPSAGMLWYSDDLVDWRYHPIEPFDCGYAPTVAVCGDWLYLTASWDRGSAIWRAAHPLGPWQRLGSCGYDADGNEAWLIDHEGKPRRWGDPCLFTDTDGELYCYCNLDRSATADDRHPWNLMPEEGKIFGVRLCREEPFRFAEAPRLLHAFDGSRRWECGGEHHQHTAHPVFEGPWMNRIGGRYYLQYSVSGTQYRNYAVACAVANHPLGPFTLQARNPILIQRGGMINGCGHHSIVEGPDHQLWCFYTLLIGAASGVERRIGMDPAGLDDNRELFVNGPTETPQSAPAIGGSPRADYVAASGDCGLIPLTEGCPIFASSSQEGREPFYANDRYIRTRWQATDHALPQWLEVDLEGRFPVCAARVIFADAGLDYQTGVLPAPYCFRIMGKDGEKDWTPLCDCAGNQEEKHIVYETWPLRHVTRVRLEILAVPQGMTAAVTQFTVFGTPA